MNIKKFYGIDESKPLMYSNSAHPPAMNTASPTDAEKFAAHIAESDRAMADPPARVLAERCDCMSQCPTCRAPGAESGSATSGEAVLDFSEQMVVHSSWLPGFAERIRAETRAALAASADQANTPVPPTRGNTCPECGGSLSTWKCTCNPIWPGYFATPVAERAAAAPSPLMMRDPISTASLLCSEWDEAPQDTDDWGNRAATHLHHMSLEIIKLWVERAAAPASVPEGYALTLTRYGFDGTMGGEFGEHPEGPYILWEDFQAAKRTAQCELPEMPTHPESHTYQWTQKEIQVIQKWGASQRQEGRREELEHQLARIRHLEHERDAALLAARHEAANADGWRAKSLAASTPTTATLSTKDIARLIEQHTGLTERRDEREFAELVRLVDAVLGAAPTAAQHEQGSAVREAVERAARICESACICDNGEDGDTVNWVLRNRATQIRALASPTAGEASAEKGGAA